MHAGDTRKSPVCVIRYWVVLKIIGIANFYNDFLIPNSGYYIYRRIDRHRKKVGLDVQTADTSSMAIEQHQPRKAAEPKNERPFPTLLPATAATPGLVVVTSATAIRIL